LADTPARLVKGAETMSTEERLERLEREVLIAKRRTRWLLVAVGVVVVGLALTWALANTTATAQAQGARVVPQEIRAKEFILEDWKGKVRLRLHMMNKTPGMSLYEENGQNTVELSSGGLALLDETGKIRAVLVATRGGGTDLILNDENGNTRATLSADRHEGSLTVGDEKGFPIWSAPPRR
jgi:hypothetical protein